MLLVAQWSFILQVDGRRGWIVVLCASYVLLVVQGISTNAGIMYNHLTSEHADFINIHDEHEKEILRIVNSFLIGSQFIFCE